LESIDNKNSTTKFLHLGEGDILKIVITDNLVELNNLGQSITIPKSKLSNVIELLSFAKNS